MEPNKTEKDFKQKLEQRTIQPSEMAWDRLDAMLSVAENKKPKKRRTWMYMAASLIVFLLAGALFLKQEKNNDSLENNTTNSVVIKDNNSENTIQPAINNTTVITPAVHEESIVLTDKNHNSTIKTVKPKSSVVKEEKTVQSSGQEQIASLDAKEQPIIIQAKDADQLLASAINNTAPKKRATVKVDANSLLSTVEGELNDSYRSKAFQGVVKSFNTVKVAVSNRNHE